MKKITAVIISLIIAFSFATSPVTGIEVMAVDSTSESQEQNLSVEVICEIIAFIHNSFGSLYAAFGKSCPVCAKLHKAEDTSERAEVIRRYKEAASKTKYMMHALGGMEKKYTYTNSVDALRKCYEEGCRFFELDVSLTSDDKPVCAHSSTVDGVENVWKKGDWTKKLGQKYDPKHPLASYDEFMSFVIQGKFKATSFADVVDFMAEHDDVYIMLDIGSRSYKGTKKIYEAMVAVADGNTDVLNRFIAGGRNDSMMRAVKEAYDFPLLNLYFAAEIWRQDIMRDPGMFVAYCRQQGITSFSVSTSTYGSEDVTPLLDELIGYVFTTDNASEAAAMHQKGLVAGTNFLR